MIRLGALGDVVRTMPAVAGVRRLYPHSHLAWLVEPKSEGAVAAHPDVDEVIVFPRDVLEESLSRLRLRRLASVTGSIIRTLRRGRFDVVVDFNCIFNSGILTRLTGAGCRIAHGPPLGRELSWIFSNQLVGVSETKISRFGRNAALVAHLGGEVEASYRLQPDAAQVSYCPKDFGAVVVIHPGTSAGTPFKRYPAEHYGRVARALADDPGLVSLVTSGPDSAEQALAKAVVDASGGAARLAPRTRGFADLANLYAAARLFIGSDSGPLHVASMVGTPVVQLLGPTDPVENEPYAGTAARQVRLDLRCSPCRRGCAQAACMSGIGPERVVAAARDLLAKAEVGDAERAGPAL
jgi:heptosyltransferase-1